MAVRALITTPQLLRSGAGPGLPASKKGQGTKLAPDRLWARLEGIAEAAGQVLSCTVANALGDGQVKAPEGRPPPE